VAGAHAVALHGLLLLPSLRADLAEAINLSLARTLFGGEPAVALAERPE